MVSHQKPKIVGITTASSTTPSKPSTATTTTTTTTAASTGSSVSNTTTSSAAKAADDENAIRVSNRVLEPLMDTLTDNVTSWHGASLLSVTQITPGGLSRLFGVTDSMKELVRNGGGGDDRLRHCVLATVFYEASTRTSCSFQAAMQRLGGTVVHVDGNGNSSANKKGETLSDTIRCLECYVDATVLRHPRQGAVGQVVADATKPVLNAGDGVGEHPTQALLDLYTICNELGIALPDNPQQEQQQEELVILLVGDLKHGRTVHSLAKLVARSGLRAKLRYCAPTSLEMPQYVRDYVAGYGLEQEEMPSLEEAVVDAHVLYVTRVQKERFASVQAYEQVKGSYVVDEALMAMAPPEMIVMHPLPRVDEIAKEVDKNPKAAYFRQMENGMYTRMALLALVLGKATNTNTNTTA